MGGLRGGWRARRSVGGRRAGQRRRRKKQGRDEAWLRRRLCKRRLAHQSAAGDAAGAHGASLPARTATRGKRSRKHRRVVCDVRGAYRGRGCVRAPLWLRCMPQLPAKATGTRRPEPKLLRARPSASHAQARAMTRATAPQCRTCAATSGFDGGREAGATAERRGFAIGWAVQLRCRAGLLRGLRRCSCVRESGRGWRNAHPDVRLSECQRGDLSNLWRTTGSVTLENRSHVCDGVT